MNIWGLARLIDWSFSMRCEIMANDVFTIVVLELFVVTGVSVIAGIDGRLVLAEVG
jgi:hypothetical protein